MSASSHRDGTALDLFRKQQQDIFTSTYIDDNAQREPLSSSDVSPKTASEKRVNLKRRADTDNLDGPKSSPSKKMKSITTVTRGTQQNETPSRRSDRMKKHGAPEDTTDEQESPLAKKSKTAATDKGKGKAPAYNLPPRRTRPAGITSMLRQKTKLPLKHTPSSQLAPKHPKLKVEPDGDETPEPTDSEHEYDENHVESSGSATKKANGKKEPRPAIPTDFVGTHTGMGTSHERPANATLNKPWSCAHRNCSSGMTWHPRDGKGTEGFGRKNISNYFGRNKRETRYIDEDVWHAYCRKDYQRQYYKAIRLPTGAFGWHMNNLKMQFRRLKLWRPDALFNVQLSKNMHAKSNEWHQILRNHNNDKEAAQQEFEMHERWGVKARKENKKGKVRPMKEEEAFPVELVDRFERDCCGHDMDYDRVDEVLEHIMSLHDDGTLTVMPPIEFLIHEVEEGETLIDPTHNYARWVAQCDGVEFYTPEASEDEDEGGVKQEAIESDGSEIHVAGAGDGTDSSRDNLIDAVANADTDEDVNVKEESDADSAVETAERVELQRAFTPFITPAKKRFKLTAVNPGRGQRLSSTFGARPGSGRRVFDADQDTIAVPKRE